MSCSIGVSFKEMQSTFSSVNMALIERNYCFSYLTGLVVIFNYHLIEKRLMFWCFFFVFVLHDDTLS